MGIAALLFRLCRGDRRVPAFNDASLQGLCYRHAPAITSPVKAISVGERVRAELELHDQRAAFQRSMTRAYKACAIAMRQP
jgi:hypothetical protein